MKTIDISQLKQELQSATDEPYAVKDNGELVGYFYRAKKKQPLKPDADWQRLEAALDLIVFHSL